MRNYKLVLAMSMAVLLSGCVAFVRSTVLSFHTLPAVTAGTAYAFVPFEGQSGNLEYQTYVNYIRAQLAAHQWTETDASSAQLLVSFGYSVDQGKVVTANVPVFGQTGISGATTSGVVDSSGNFQSTTTYTPSYGITGYVPVSRMAYSRALRIQMIDRASVDAQMPHTVYQADVISVGTSGILAVVMPNMVKALFKDFPGESGRVRTIVLSRPQ